MYSIIIPLTLSTNNTDNKLGGTQQFHLLWYVKGQFIVGKVFQRTFQFQLHLPSPPPKKKKKKNWEGERAL